MKDNHKNLILQSITGLTKEQLFFSSHPQPLSQREKGVYNSYVERLDSGEPIEYILEQAEFYGLDFFVDKRVLIPRNDTEIMVDEVLSIIPHSISPIGREAGNIVYIDVGTGSGCIPISVLKNTSQNFEQTYSLDVSEAALEVAEVNIKKYNLESKIKLLKSDLLENILDKNIQDKQIIITANLPYIKQGDFENMDDAVYTHEPKLALYGGENTGFEIYEKLIRECQELARSGNKITLFIEIGFDQKKICEDFLTAQSLDYEIFKDEGGVDRCVKVEIY